MKRRLSRLHQHEFQCQGRADRLPPEDAYRCFEITDMDVLVLGRYVLCKHEQVESTTAAEREGNTRRSSSSTEAYRYDARELMALIDINWNPSKMATTPIRSSSACIAFPLIGWVWSGGRGDVTGWMAAIGVVCAATGLFYPLGLKPIFLLLTCVAVPIGIVVGELAMLVVYFGLILPIATVFRCTGRDNPHRKLTGL